MTSHRFISLRLPFAGVAASLALLLFLWATPPACFAQAEADPIKLFERGQDAHAKNDLPRALEFYDEALALRPEFPEAEFQKAAALAALDRNQEAEVALRRAVEGRPDWSLPQLALGTLLLKTSRDREAESVLRRALELEPNNRQALVALGELRVRQTEPAARVEGVALLRRASNLAGATARDHFALAVAERATGDAAAAKRSLDKALALDAKLTAARAERGTLHAEAGDYAAAIHDLEIARGEQPASNQIAAALAKTYVRADQIDKAKTLLASLDSAAQSSPEIAAVRAALADEQSVTPEEIAALEKQLSEQPRDANLLARLGALLRTRDPQRALGYWRRALEVAPTETAYATGYAAALVQARRFAEAVGVLRQVVARRPDDYAAHANLATALYELGSFEEAIAEYRWLVDARPESAAIAHFFIATAYDRARRFEEALAAYQTFLEKADPARSNLEIEKVKLRLPSLRNQIKRGEGVKQK